jgi:hypothetical protein
VHKEHGIFFGAFGFGTGFYKFPSGFRFVTRFNYFFVVMVFNGFMDLFDV